MANPRQRRKARSKSYKPVSISKNAKRNLKKMPPIQGPKVLQGAWDKKKTVRQNYASLGLLHTLVSTSSGGVEHTIGTETIAASPELLSSEKIMPLAEGELPKGYGKIIRDSLGNVIGVEMGEDDEDQRRKGGEEQKDVDMEQLEPILDETALEQWTLRGVAQNRKGLEKPDVVAELQRTAAPTRGSSTTVSAVLSGVGARHATAREVAYLQQLVERYGKDLERMSKDHKLNYNQYSAGQLKRALKRAGLGGTSG